MVSQKIKQAIIAMESPYDKAMRLKFKLTKSKTHAIKIEHARRLNLNPESIVSTYPRSFKLDNGYVKFNNDLLITT